MINSKKKYEILSAEIAQDFHIENGFVIEWTAKNFGFGLLTFYTDKNGDTVVETECMSKEFCKAVMDKFFESLKFENI